MHVHALILSLDYVCLGAFLYKGDRWLSFLMLHTYIAIVPLNLDSFEKIKFCILNLL